MNKQLILSIVLLAAAGLPAAAQQRIAGTRLANFTIVYSSALEDEEGIDAARTLQRQLAAAGAPQPKIQPDTAFGRGRAIRIVRTAGRGPFDYAVRVVRGDLEIDGGGAWAMAEASQRVAEQIGAGGIARGAAFEGTVEGKHLFARTEGSNLRILTDNIWDYSKEEVPKVWRELGEDPRDEVRAPQFAQLVRAYMPDVLDLQEYSRHMHERFYPLIERYGYRIAHEGEEPWNNTPIFYNPATVELVDVNYVLYAPAVWSNKGSKSFTSAVFRKKDTGRTFAVINTHLWWKAETDRPGSDYARAAQVRLMMAEAEMLKSKYGCTVFVTGDMNCYEDSLPIRQFLDGGYTPCYKASAGRTDLRNGHHICSASDGYSRTSRRRSPDREGGAIDHCFIYNAQEGVKVVAFDCITARFTVKLTDHYPYLVDAAL